MTALRGLPRIISRPGAADTLPYELEGEVLLVTDQGVADTGVLSKLSHSNWPALVQEVGEPTHEAIDELAEYLRESTPDWVVALGGGSVMDVVKLASCLASEKHPLSSYSHGAIPLPPPLCRRACIPTTVGTGSEVTRKAAFQDQAGQKAWLSSEHVGSELIVLDGEFTFGMDKLTSSISGLCTVAHALEAFMSPKCCELTSGFCLQALSLAGLHLPVVQSSPNDMKARQGMLVASLFAGVGLDLCGGGLAFAAAAAAQQAVGMPPAAAVVWATPAAIFWNQPNASERYSRAARSLASDSFTQIMQAWRTLAHLGESHPQPEGLTVEVLKGILSTPEFSTMLTNSPRQVGPNDLDEWVELLLEPR